MCDSRLKKIRQAEKESHMQLYSSTRLYEQGSWLQKPVKTVLDIIPEFQGYQELRILDLGGGVGRNCIPFAQEYHDISCKIECVDLLDLAIEKLNENARAYQVDSYIEGIVVPIEEYFISENSYDFIMAISALEHVASEAALLKKLEEIRKGIRENGIICLVMNSNVVECDREAGKELPPQFEVNLPTEKLVELLDHHFGNWNKMKQTICRQKYEIPRENGMVELTTNVVTYVAGKRLM